MHDKGQIIDAIVESEGRLKIAAELAGCSLRTIYNFSDRDEEVADAIRDSRREFDEDILDLAHIGIREKIKDGSFHAMKYVLSTKGKHLGFTEKKEIEHSGDTINQIIVEMDTSDDDDNEEEV